MIRFNPFLIALLIALIFIACNPHNEDKSFGEIALDESAIPVRPGEPGKTPFWNKAAKRFIYAPAFDFKQIDGASKYRFDVLSLGDSALYSFENEVAWAPLSPVWTKMPVGQYSLTVTGVSNDSGDLGVAGHRRFYRAAPFNGVYHQPVMPYDSSAMLALDNLMKENYVRYWFEHRNPDPGYLNYRYPAKIYSALVIGAVTHARLHANTPEAAKSTELAQIVADFMLGIRYRPGSAWEYFVPTYYGVFNIKDRPHMDSVNNFTMMGVDAGYAFLDLFDLVGDEKYFDAAKKIADTYLKNQMDNGSWHQFVNYATDSPVAENVAIPTAVINYFDRLERDYKVSGLASAKSRALQYVMDNPVRTFDWQGQFEDVYARPPYMNLSREQACELAIYLLKNSGDQIENIALAEELIRFSEDQFVIWEKPMPRGKNNRRNKEGFDSENWITPSVQEQYVFWNPVGRSAGIMVETFWQAYETTQNEMYLAKAKSLANSFTLVQQHHGGDYPTFFTRYEMPLWLNSAVYPARVLMNLQERLKTEDGERIP